MEAIGAAASIVTLAGVALQGTQTLCQTLSNFKNASLQASRINAAIQNLDSLLKQLQSSRITKERSAHAEGLKDLLVAYNKDVQRYMKDLRFIQAISTDSLTERASKKLRIAYKGDRELLRILAEITQQCVALAAQLDLANCDAALEIRDGVQQIHASNEARVDRESEQISLARHQTARLNNIGNSIKQVETTVESIKTSSSNMEHSVAEVALKLDKIAGISQKQGDDVLTLLLALQAQMNGVSSQLNSRTGSHHIELENTSSGLRFDGHSDLLRALDRLQSAGQQKPGAVHSSGAESLITDIECILLAMTSLADGEHSSLPRRLLRPSNFGTLDDHDTKRLCKIVNASHTLNINTASRRTLSMPGTPSQQHKRKDVMFQSRRLVLSLTERRFHNQVLSKNVAGADLVVDTIAKLHVQVASTQPCTSITAYFHHRMTQDCCISLTPTVLFGNSVSDDSAIFRAVSLGDTRRVRQLLDEGLYTLRDRNSKGTPLLHFAMTQPNMCKFLVDNGADVDDMSWDRFRKDRYCPPLSQYTYDHSIRAERLEAIIECRKILLRAGADPTLHSGDNKNEYQRAVAYCTLKSLKAILDCDQGFINLEERFDGGQTALFKAALFDSVGHEARKVQLLLDRGADIHARDDEGYTCLHAVLQAARLPSKYTRDIALLTLLIRRGANILSKANNGRSIFEDAYDCSSISVITTGSYRADLWDCTLVCSGHGHLARRADQRRFCYTEQYTHELFEAMWSGGKEVCPYFDDTFSISWYNINKGCEDFAYEDQIVWWESYFQSDGNERAPENGKAQKE
ncbi:ankyrin repeat-containing domain protein [Lophiotrema nucula]|uniref:protein S-acyltransferase n=1 Tax=Lophiotrema nucula TaxID=690887 RepID=A0A6A5ZII2_9PLEO|nr:ankyrin repeat-containing domain protein [Lophiotrema nucula]